MEAVTIVIPKERIGIVSLALTAQAEHIRQAIEGQQLLSTGADPVWVNELEGNRDFLLSAARTLAEYR